MNTTHQDSMLYQLDRVMRLLKRRHAGKHMRRSGLRILSMVKKNEGISTRELAERMDIRPASLNESLQTLEQEEKILRRRDPRDQRSFLIDILPEGEALLEEMRAAREAFAARSEGLLSKEETKTLTELLRKLADGLAELSLEDTDGAS